MSVDSERVMGIVYGAASAVANSSVPFENHIASGWTYMTDNYSEFTIATLFSVILHEVNEVKQMFVFFFFFLFSFFSGCSILMDLKSTWMCIHPSVFLLIWFLYANMD